MKSWRIGIAGLGVVGSELARMLQGQSAGSDGSILKTRLSDFTLSSISARNRSVDRGFGMEGITWFDDPVAMARSDEIDIFVELMGGQEGPALESVTAALGAGKHVVTANKALLATHGAELARLAEEKQCCIGYEAAIAGGIPIICTLKTVTAPCNVDSIAGILNGTCNYILSEMEAHGIDFAEALADAQRLGFAEADPSLDIHGDDAAHKLALLTALSFGQWPLNIFETATHAGTEPDSDAQNRLFVEGVAAISATDIQAANGFGYRIRLLGIAHKLHGAGDEVGIGSSADNPAPVSLTIQPMAVPIDHPLAQAVGPDNHLMITGTPLGTLNLSGPGAGGGPTASAVAGDVLAIANGVSGPVFGRPANLIAPLTLAIDPNERARFVLRIENARETGVSLISGLGIEASLLEPLESQLQSLSDSRDFIARTGLVEVASVKKAVQALRAAGYTMTSLRIAEF